MSPCAPSNHGGEMGSIGAVRFKPCDRSLVWISADRQKCCLMTPALLGSGHTSMCPESKMGAVGRKERFNSRLKDAGRRAENDSVPTDDGLDALGRAVLYRRISPDDALREIVSALHSTEAPDFDLITRIGVGPLETLFHQGFEQALWPEVERLAREDERFRRALGTVWGFSSPMFGQREALLRELGEYRTVTVRFTVEPRTFEETDGYQWRRVEVDGISERPHLGRILRDIADHVDHWGDPVFERPPAT
jgi:hypothetical protein